MRRYSSTGGGGTDVLADVTLLLLGLFIVITSILIHFIGDPKDDNEESKNQGAMLIELYWPDELDTDVDLWVKVPGAQNAPVGYSHLSAPDVNLLRDDLGKTNDVSHRNQEIAVVRSLSEGEYAINAHLYGLKTGQLPIKCRVVISYKASLTQPLRQFRSVTFTLTEPRQEITVIRFRLDEDLRPVPESIFHEYIPLRRVEGHPI